MDLDENRECIYGDDITVEDSVWMGPQTALEELSRQVGIGSAEPLARLAEILKKAMQQGRTIHILPPYRQDTTLQLSDLLGITPSELNSHISETMIRAVVAQRSVKSPEEIEQIELALEISYETQILAMQKAAPGQYERDIVGAMEALGEDYVGYTETIKRRPEFGWRSLRLAKTLQPNFVVTVEPGIYFIPELVRQWKQKNKFSSFINYNEVEKFLDFGGIRIEDDVLVTTSGNRILEPLIPKDISELEAIA